MVLGNFHYWGVQLIWFEVAIGPAAVAVGEERIV